MTRPSLLHPPPPGNRNVFSPGIQCKACYAYFYRKRKGKLGKKDTQLGSSSLLMIELGWIINTNTDQSTGKKAQKCMLGHAYTYRCSRNSPQYKIAQVQKKCMGWWQAQLCSMPGCVAAREVYRRVTEYRYSSSMQVRSQISTTTQVRGGMKACKGKSLDGQQKEKERKGQPGRQQ